jgi:NTP pyrophosphatase (non-canonical NTP hydrolase)
MKLRDLLVDEEFQSIERRDLELVVLDDSPLDECELDRRFLVRMIKKLDGDFLRRFRAVNVARATHDFKTFENAGILYMTTALAGEAGELAEIINLIAVQNLLNAKIGSICNLIKKMERHKIGGPDHGNTTKIADITPEKLRDEIGGIQIYLDLLAALLDIGIEEATTETFNNVSNKIGSSYRL